MRNENRVKYRIRQFIVKASPFWLLIWAAVSLGQSTGDDIDLTIAKIVKARDYTAQFVVLAKQEFKQGSPEYNQAFKLYAVAYSDYSAWNAYVTSALASGRIKDKKGLPNDPKYDVLSASAVKSGTEFVAYVDANTKGQTKAIETVIASLTDLGIKLWTDIADKRAQDRASSSKRFSDATVWQTWAQVTDGSSPLPKPEPVSTPSKANSDSKNGSKPTASKDNAQSATSATPSDAASKKKK